MIIMKLSGYFVLLAALSFGSAAQASFAIPRVTGTVQRVGGSTITVDGHSYQVTAKTTSDAGIGSPQPGQQITLSLSADGSTVIAIHAASPTATH
jgi:hypothetical protein